MLTAATAPFFSRAEYSNKTRVEQENFTDCALPKAARLLQTLGQDDGYLNVTTPKGVFVEFKTIETDQFWIEIWHEQYSGTFACSRTAARILERALADFGGTGPKDDLSSADIEWLY